MSVLIMEKIKLLTTKYNRTLASLTEITYSEGANDTITAYVPFSATSFNPEASLGEVDSYGKQWCSIEGMQQYGADESIYILKLRINKYKMYDSFQNGSRVAVISGIFATKNAKMSFPFEFKITQLGCFDGEPIEGDIIFWKISGCTDTFYKIEGKNSWSGNNYGIRIIESSLITDSKLKVTHCIDLCGFFSGQKMLENVSFDDCNFSGVTSLANMFYNCSHLESIEISDWDINKAYTLDSMFSKCTSLTSVTFPSISSQECTNISSLFKGCSSLLHADVTGINTENVTTISSIFEGCSSLETVDVSNFSTSNCKDMTNAFNGCRSLAQIDIRNWDVSSCTSFYGMFMMCQSLTNIIGGENEICGSMAMIGASKSFDISMTNLDLASIVAIFLGISTLETGSNVSIKINKTQSEIARDYLSIAKSKNWKIIII